MRSLQIIHTPVRSFPHVGGVELHVHNLAKEFIRKGHKVTVIAAQSETDNDTLTPYKRLLLPWLFKVTNTEITYSLPYHLLKSKNSIVHSHIPTPWTSDWSMLIGTIKRQKKVLTIHNDMNKEGFAASLLTKFYVNTAMKLSLFLADKIIIVNPDWEQTFSFTSKVLQPHKNKIKYVPNAVDLEIFHQQGRKKKHHILCVSILDKYHDYKGIPYLLEAFQHVLAKYPDSTLQIVGEGELKDVYIKRAKELGVYKSTFFTGSATQKKLAAIYSEATVLVLPSTDTEGFGLVLLESLACGTPIIATKVAGVVEEIQKNDCGIIVPVRDSKAIETAIINYFNNPQLEKQHGENGKKLVAKKYSWDIVANETEKIYGSIL